MKSTPVAPEVVLLHGFTGPTEDIVAAVEVISAAAPFRHLKTPGGRPMSAAMTNCGALGWVSDVRGYRYEACDPLTGRPWHALRTPTKTFSRLNDSVAPLRLMMLSRATSCVENLCPHSGHSRRRRICVPSSTGRESTTRESSCLQNGQIISACPL